MSHCIVPDWNQRKQSQEKIQGEDPQRNNSTSSQVQQSPQNLSFIVPMSINYQVGELAWDNNKQPFPLHGNGGAIQLPSQTKPTWSSTRTGDTLESLVHQATLINDTTPLRHRGDLGPTYSASIPTGKWVVENSKSTTSRGVKWMENPTQVAMTTSHMQVEHNDHGVKIGSLPMYSGLKISSGPGKRAGAVGLSSGLVSKRIRSESERNSGTGGLGVDASATFCKENTDTTMMTWASFESAPSTKTHTNVEDDSACQDLSDEEFGNKDESARSQSSARRSRAAVVHNESERRRRDRINEKMKALQKLVPNANKTDKASMLDEVIQYLKQLQAQVQMLTNARAMPQMVMPLGMQQQLQMSLLGRMGIGMGMGMGIGPVGMGMVDVNNLARNMPQPFPALLHGATPLSTAPSFVSPPFPVPSLAPPLTDQLKANINAADISRSLPGFNDSYGTFLAQQSMNMDFYSRMASLYRQQQAILQPSKKPDSLLRQNNV